MKKWNLLLGILIGFVIFTSCSNNDSTDSNLTNGFKVNGTFYSTDFAKASTGDPYHFIISNPLNHNAEEGQFGSFYLRKGIEEEGIKLIEGVYSTSNGHNSYFGIDNNPIHFQKNSEEGNFGYSAYWNIDEDFQSGTVTINSITTNIEASNERISEINMDYQFRWNGITIIGNYSGTVDSFQ